MIIPQKLDEQEEFFIPFSNLIRPSPRLKKFIEEGVYKHVNTDRDKIGLLQRGNELLILLVVLSITFVFLYLSSSYSRFLKSFKNEEDDLSDPEPEYPPYPLQPEPQRKGRAQTHRML